MKYLHIFCFISTFVYVAIQAKPTPDFDLEAIKKNKDDAVVTFARATDKIPSDKPPTAVAAAASFDDATARLVRTTTAHGVMLRRVATQTRDLRALVNRVASAASERIDRTRGSSEALKRELTTSVGVLRLRRRVARLACELSEQRRRSAANRRFESLRRDVRQQRRFLKRIAAEVGAEILELKAVVASSLRDAARRRRRLTSCCD